MCFIVGILFTGNVRISFINTITRDRNATKKEANGLFMNYPNFAEAFRPLSFTFIVQMI